MNDDSTRLEDIESRYTSRRIFELQENPVKGNFNAAHLKEIHRRIFQDMPAKGLDGFSPGEFRPTTSSDKLHNKNRNLCELSTRSYVGYSWMDKPAQANLNRILETANPAQLSKLKKDDFAKTMSNLYTQLDYIHPFREGNSRTLREFTRQLARDSGYDMNWKYHNQSDKHRDNLYLARDRAVGQIALKHLPESTVSVRIEESIERYKSRPDLQDLMQQSIRPNRAAAFEKLPEKEALKAHPELSDAFKTLHKAKQYFEAKIPGSTSGQKTALQMVKECIQARLNEGETRGFKPVKQTETKKRPVRAKDEPEMER
jgi:cell filamentation protein